ncbi:hypothetical protein Taro_011968 [Colocasia esculenta]|uniref:Cytidyltransferase-like domain-containing protein n=1 Tax=Colocasia esculenta TaxID=4460 RepID=A0A843UE78_COLES|nr:hypothetical protein [Colocasia esculenta]
MFCNINTFDNKNGFDLILHIFVIKMLGLTCTFSNTMGCGFMVLPMFGVKIVHLCSLHPDNAVYLFNIMPKAVADACKVDSTFDLELSEKELAVESEKLFDEDQELEQLVGGEICMKIYPFDAPKPNADGKVILSGSFNPLHDGHLRLLEVASSIYSDRIPCFEISAINADKPPLSVTQIKERVKQFEKVGMHFSFL